MNAFDCPSRWRVPTRESHELGRPVPMTDDVADDVSFRVLMLYKKAALESDYAGDSIAFDDTEEGLQITAYFNCGLASSIVIKPDGTWYAKEYKDND